MSTIQIKRGLSEKLSTIELKAGEPAFTTDTGKLYIGDGTNKIAINPIDKPIDLDTTKSYTKFTVNEYGQIVTQSDVTASDLPNDIPVEKITGLGSAALKNVGIASGELPLLDSNGKLDLNVIPSIAITDVYTAASEQEMLALDVQQGDICVRSDVNKTYILKQQPATAKANWVELKTPTDLVQSVNTKTGVVVLNSNDILMEGYTKPVIGGNILVTDNISQAVGKLEKNLEKYATINSPTFTGIPISPTATLGTNTDQIATTAFVTSALNIIDGGTF